VAVHVGEDVSMKRDRDPYVRGSMLKHSTESTLRHLAEMYGQNELKQAAEVARENARRCLEAADAKAAERRVRKEQRASTAANSA
jgi:hypothetical protein